MSLQRKRGETAYIYPSKLVLDARGNEQRMTDMDAEPAKVRAAFSPEGDGETYKMLAPHRIGNLEIDAWCRVVWRDAEWDVTGPPLVRQGPARGTRHQVIRIRRRLAVHPA